MTYELLIREKQPACGGKDPTKTTIQSVTTDDPLAYVRGLEPSRRPEAVIAECRGLIEAGY